MVDTTNNNNDNVKIVTYNKKYLPQFVALNKMWIQQYFEIEPTDILQLEQAEQSIIDTGGEILFLVDTHTDTVYGCVAMVYDQHHNTWELAKMCVRSDQQGKKYGDRLMRAAIQWARDRQIHTITILSSTSLTPAITLYKKHGFKTVKEGEGINEHYKRCTIEMILDLKGHNEIHNVVTDATQVPDIATV